MKKLISSVLAVVMVLAMVPSAFAAESGVSKFTDVPVDAWYRDELDYAVRNGYIAGTSDSTFGPDAHLSRAQFVTILGRMMNVDTTLYTSSKFTDVDMSSWYGPYVAWAADVGYVNGTSAETFSPSADITVEQMGVIMSNYITKSGVVLTPSSTFSGYTDKSSVADWAQASMDVMAVYDLLPVDVSGNVSPKKAVIRSEAAVALVRLAKGDGKGGKPISATPASATNPPQTGEQTKVVTNPAGTKTYDYSTMSDRDIACLEVVMRAYDELRESGMITDTTSLQWRAVYYAWWLMVHSDYDDSMTDPNRHSAYGALVVGTAVCDGHAYAFKMLMDYEGIECKVILDWASKHAYNEVFIDGVWYEFDVQQVGGLSSDGRGGFNQFGAELVYEKYLDPDEFAAKNNRYDAP